MYFRTFSPDEKIPQGIISPRQTHSTEIREIKNGKENLESVDGIFSQNPDFLLGIRTADCAPLIFWEEKKWGVVHIGWRGLVGGIGEKMEKYFENPNIWIGPLLPVFEIQRDFCFWEIREKMGDRFFENNGDKIHFHFLEALLFRLPSAKWCGESTEKEKWASHRRGDKTRNLTIVGRSFGEDFQK